MIAKPSDPGGSSTHLPGQLRAAALLALAICCIGCSGGGAAVSATGGAKAEVDRILALEKAERSQAVCAILQSGFLPEVFQVDPAEINFRPASPVVPHPLCTASWDGADKARIEVGLTVTNLRFGTAAEAVTSLESTVAQLEEGITIKVRGRERTTQVDFEDFLDDVGDRAAWAPRWSELSVAHEGVRFAVSVRGAGDNEKSRSLAIELAQKIISAL